MVRWCVGCVVLAACTLPSQGLAIERVVPDAALNTTPQPVEIEGNFHRPIRSSLDDGETVIATDISITLSNTDLGVVGVPLDSPTWLAEDRVAGTVPANLPPGNYDMQVTLGGVTGARTDAYAVLGGTPIAFAVHPPTAGPGDTIAIEGPLGPGSLVVRFPSGATATALGERRAIVTVPANAGSGPLVVENAAGASPALPFRGTTYTPRPTAFFDDDVQASFARAGSSLPAPRVQAGVVVAGRFVFVVGGVIAGEPAATVLRARMFADGSLAPFELAGTLSVARAGPSVAIAGDRLLVAGGRDAAGTLASTESATIAADGTLSAFLAGPDLPEPRAFGAAQIAGDRFVIAGGEDAAGVPRGELFAAPLDDTGAPTAFVAAGALQTPRSRFALVVSRASLVAAGGLGLGGSGISVVESATVDLDTAALGSFVTGPPLAFAGRDLTGYATADTICVVGGELATERLAVECSAVDSAGVPLGFSDRGDLPSGVVGGAAVIAGDRVWIVGGGGRTRLAHAYLDDGARPGAFAAGAALAAPRRDVACAVIGDFVYLFGGFDDNGTVTGTIQRAPIDATGAIGAFEIDVIAQQTVRRGHQAVVLDQAVLLVGGSDGNANLASTEQLVFDASGVLAGPTAGRTLTAQRRGTRLAVIGDALFVVGGRGVAGTDSTWESAAISGSTLAAFVAGNTTLGSPRGFYTSAVAAGSVFVFGTFNVSNIEGARATGTQLGAFTVSDQLAHVRENHASAYAGGAIWMLGGFDAGGSVGTIEAAPTVAGGVGPMAPSAAALPPDITTGGCALRLGDFLHMVGGSANNVLAPTVWSATLATP